MNVVRSRIVELPLCDKLRLTTLAAGNDFATPAERLYVDLDVPGFRSLLMHAEDLTLLGLTESVGASTNLRWGLFAWSGYTRDTEPAVNPFQIGATVTAGGSLRHAAYATLTSFQRESRLAIGYGYATGAAGMVSGLVSATLLVKTAGM